MSVAGWRVRPSAGIQGDIRVPGDKSISHRALLFLAIAQGGGRVTGLLEAEDCLGTLGALRALGARIERLGAGDYRVEGPGETGFRSPDSPLDLGNSGTGMRLLAGLLAGQGVTATLTGDESLCRRPMERIVTPLRAMGAAIDSVDGHPPLTLSAHEGLRGIEYDLPVASAQVKSAILLAGLSARGETLVREPAPTRDHTERMLAGLGARVERMGGAVRLRPGPLSGTDIDVPGDLSSAAFFLAAAAGRQGSRLVLRPVGINPSRDGILHLLRRMGASIECENERVVGGEPVADLCVEGRQLVGIPVDGHDVALAVDEIPALLVAAAGAQGETTVTGARELRFKESDRIAAMAEGLTALGLAVTVRDDGLAVTGGPIRSGIVESRGDHRIAMSFAMLGALAPQGVSVRIRDVRNVVTSFPSFRKTAEAVGIEIEENEFD
jgi:3-phosphoshikimate 1-carboxyvinyltransferase